MYKIEDDCVDCGLPCLGDNCPYRNVTVNYCDKCGEENEFLYQYEGQELCKYCLLEEIPKVSERN